jgi:cysteine desulfurase / selenocysteine lyase
MIEIEKIRAQFPILNTEVKGKKLVYFDNAATSQKPLSVINALSNYYESQNANIHRGIHHLAEVATTAYEATRNSFAKFLNAKESQEIIITKGTTEGINLVAYSFTEKFIQAGDEIIISTLEHHSNIVPWQLACERKGAILKVIPIKDNGELDMKAFEALLSNKTKLVAVTMVSNALGTINPVQEIIVKAHKVGAKVLLDGAQATSHIKVDVQALNCDFLALSAHKMYGPTGVGILYGKRELLDAMPPYQGGGEMIAEVSFEKTTYNELPYKFEAGTPNIADVVATKAAIDFLEEVGIENIAKHENYLLSYATNLLRNIAGLKIYGTAEHKASVISFAIEGVHHQDLAILLDNFGIAVRTGHHCTQPLMKRFEISGTTRASFAVYNTEEEIDYFVESLNKVLKMLR